MRKKGNPTAYLLALSQHYLVIYQQKITPKKAKNSRMMLLF